MVNGQAMVSFCYCCYSHQRRWKGWRERRREDVGLYIVKDWESFRADYLASLLGKLIVSQDHTISDNSLGT